MLLKYCSSTTPVICSQLQGFIIQYPLSWITFIFFITLLIQNVSSHSESTGDMSSRNFSPDDDYEERPIRKKGRLEPSHLSSEFPQTLEGFKYKFNKKGQLRHIVTGEPYKFEAEKGKPFYNQKRYEALGKVITQYVYHYLESDGKLQKIAVPVDASKNEPTSFIFASKNALKTKDKLLLLINGAGAVRAGQWARRLIINDCLDSGTQLPYIKRAMQAGYEVLVLNTNENRGLNSRGERLPVRNNSSPYEHGVYVWDNFVANRRVKRVAIVAHSMGGSVTVHMAQERESSFLKKVFAIAFTDSIHSLTFTKVSVAVKKFFAKNSVNWVVSSKPLDTPVSSSQSSGLDSRRVSSATTSHGETSWSSINSVFVFLDDKEQLAKVNYNTHQNWPGANQVDIDDDDNYDDDHAIDDDDDDTNNVEEKEETGFKLSGAKKAGIYISSSDDDDGETIDYTELKEEL